MFIIQQKDHPKFKRKGEDLFVEHTLSLTEALCGFQFVLNHLDTRQLLIKSNPGEVVKPGMYFTWPDHDPFHCYLRKLFSVLLCCVSGVDRFIQDDKR